MTTGDAASDASYESRSHLISMHDYDKQLIKEALIAYSYKLLSVLRDEAVTSTALSATVSTVKVITNQLTRADELLDVL